MEEKKIRILMGDASAAHPEHGPLLAGKEYDVERRFGLALIAAGYATEADQAAEAEPEADEKKEPEPEKATAPPPPRDARAKRPRRGRGRPKKG